jgi:hypothetical protein
LVYIASYCKAQVPETVCGVTPFIMDGSRLIDLLALIVLTAIVL